MNNLDILNASLFTRFNLESVIKWRRPCRARVLLLVDGLDYNSFSGFGLWRFIHAITVDPGVTNKPVLTLADRFLHPLTSNPPNSPPNSPKIVTVGSDTYKIIENFNFAKAATPVTLANYDQIWIFGVRDGAFALSPDEIDVISAFMNGGGGVFATGDHASLGRELCGSLPRIRHMREWRDAASGGVGMGLETNVNQAVNRIDTVVNPGSNGLYEFEDQSDSIPQRIYPNYKTIDTDGAAGPGWSATVHPILQLPGAPATRNSSDAQPNLGFSNDLDVFPDHPHESVCYEVSATAILNSSYNLGSQDFPEFQPLASSPKRRVGADIVAYGVSGGRSVFNGQWKPPVKPRMFGIVSAYDGRLAQPYPGNSERPGRIVCDSTWHHYVNINLDGTGSGRSGLGTGSGSAFTPSPDLQKIYSYYRNILNWLQPANRIWCSIWWDLLAIRLHPALFEELIEIDRLVNWRDLMGLGREAKSLVSSVHGRANARDQILGLLLTDPRTQDTADLLSGNSLNATAVDADELIDGLFGALLAEVARIVPSSFDEETAEKLLSKGPEPYLPQLQNCLVKSLQLGVKHQSARLERSVAIVKRLGQLKEQ